MKFSTLAILVLLTLPIHLVFGQAEDFTLKDYKYPDLRRDALNTYFDFTNTFGFKKTETDDVVEPVKENDATVGLDVRLEYSQYRQNRNWQRSIFAIIDNDLDHKRTKDDSDKVLKDLQNNTYFSIRSENRGYSKNNIFIEGNGQIILDNAHSKASSITSTRTEKLINRNGLFNAGIGKGRLEFVRDAHVAMYILKDLEKYGLLAKPLSAADYKELADVIARVGNERFFDNRHKRIFQLEQIDSVLQTRGVLVEGNAKAFTLINDNLFFAGMPSRFSGSRLSVGLQGNYSILKSKNETDINMTETTSTTFGRGGYVAYNLEIPASLLIQHSLTAKAGYLYSTNEFDVALSNFSNADVNGSLRYELGIYPNTRTIISVYGAVDGNIRNQERDEAHPLVESKVSNVWTRIGTEMYYYVSPQFRLSGSYRFNHSNNEVDIVTVPVFDTSNTINSFTRSQFHIGLDYFFF